MEFARGGGYFLLTHTVDYYECYVFVDWCWACYLHYSSGISRQWDCLMVISRHISTFSYFCAQQFIRL